MTRCGVCGHENSGESLFCGRCTSPIAVIPLHELDDRDHRRCLAVLFEMLGEQSIRAMCNPEGAVNEELWRAYLSAFWLRPETALILYAEALAIREMELESTGPWLDLGCGDGIHGALYSGWRFNQTFDAFASLDLTAADMYNHFDAADFSVKVEREGRRIDFGIDIKTTAVARARALGVFSDVRQADATALPLADKSVRVIFSNMLRDLGDPLPAALAECRRVLRDDGTLLISAMTPFYARNLYFVSAARRAENDYEHETARRLLKLDRGRSVFCQRQLTEEQWQELLADSGLTLHGTHKIVGEEVIKFWDVGLRPFIHALLAQRQSWAASGALPAIKESLVSGLNYLLAPLVRSIDEGVTCMRLLEVRKR